MKLETAGIGNLLQQSTMIASFEEIVENYFSCIQLGNTGRHIDGNFASILLLAEFYSVYTNKQKINEIIWMELNRIQSKLYGMAHHKKLSLFGGLTDLAFAATILNLNTKNYNRLEMKLNASVVATVPSYVNSLQSDIAQLSFGHYDCVSGAAGILRYLLTCLDDNSLKSSEQLLNYLVSVSNQNDPWFVRKENFIVYHGESIRPYSGAINLSLSHGIAGVLAVMSIAMQKGLHVRGQQEVMQQICEYFLLSFYKEADGIPFWPSLLLLDPSREPILDAYISKMSWCYGTPGILRAIQIYANTINDNGLKNWAYNAFENISKMTLAEMQMDSPTFCHGMAGLMTILNLVNQERPSQLISDCVLKLFSRILSTYSRQNEFGFKNTDIIRCGGEKIIKSSDDSSLMTGTPGILLSLLAVLKPETSFEEHFLIK